MLQPARAFPDTHLLSEACVAARTHLQALARLPSLFDQQSAPDTMTGVPKGRGLASRVWFLCLVARSAIDQRARDVRRYKNSAASVRPCLRIAAAMLAAQHAALAVGTPRSTPPSSGFSAPRRGACSPRLAAQAHRPSRSAGERCESRRRRRQLRISSYARRGVSARSARAPLACRSSPATRPSGRR